MPKKINKKDLFFLNCLPIAILIFNHENKVFFANDEAVNLYGYDLEEFKSMSILNLRPEWQMEIEKSIMEYFFYNRKNHRILSKHKTKEGKILDVDIQTTILEINDEIFLLECIREITEQQNVLRSYERAIDIMAKVVKDLTQY
ncbi:PAS domain S-box protein [Paramaledivibacter caminithermalis]|jgi:PAS domain S-box-containing protein|uniref:PAS domain S-box-containing protein n=1 Tax=Paramaledivibacter caminithermalis (strain DSM 15212 / CIP 107654 / DViRD3) TaxID=1121301 RepID=A0A1M6P8G3_PARC5|nr:PAS domain-containing protein [Paramaledivibacter caminithermalis]SHK04241.1 PAS domain S-box-containing protein [Paramaledivibacter caminithermalis DSM 15212]